MIRRQALGQFLTFTGLLAVAITTLFPLPEQKAAAEATPLWCLVCGDYGGVDVLSNVLLFVPLGAGLRLRGMSLRSVVALGALLSLVVESLQYVVIAGRDPSLSDLVTNTLGSWLGAILGGRYRQLLWPDPKGAGFLALAGVLVWWTIQTGTAALLRPWAPPGELRAKWARAIPGRAAVDGTRRSAVVSGVPVEADSKPVNTGLAERINSGLVQLQIEFTTGRAWPAQISVFELRGRSGDVLSVEAWRRDLIVQMPARAQAWRLRPPALRLAGAVPGTEGMPFHLTAGERGDTVWAAWGSRSLEWRAKQVLSPSLGWSLLVPFEYAYGKEVPWLTGLWLAGWMILIGHWSAHARMGWYRLPWFLVVLLVGLGIVPHLMGYSAIPLAEWLAAASGLAVGSAGHRFAA